jgi:hypothetical protein
VLFNLILIRYLFCYIIRKVDHWMNELFCYIIRNVDHWMNEFHFSSDMS